MNGGMVIKNSGRRRSEQFNADKLKQSIEAACLSVRLPDGVASDTAQRTAHAVGEWMKHKPEVTSEDIRRVAARELHGVSPEASYLYKHHKKII